MAQLNTLESPLVGGIESLRGFQVAINSLEVVKDPLSVYALYQINVQVNVFSWTVKRRYSEFVTLHSAILEAIPASKHSILPSLPSKKIFGSSVNPVFIEERKENLQQYLQHMTRVPEAWQVPELVRFVDVETSMFSLQHKISALLDHAGKLQAHQKHQQEQLLAAKSQLRREEDLVTSLSRHVAELEGQVKALQAQERGKSQAELPLQALPEHGNAKGDGKESPPQPPNPSPDASTTSDNSSCGRVKDKGIPPLPGGKAPAHHTSGLSRIFKSRPQPPAMSAAAAADSAAAMSSNPLTGGRAASAAASAVSWSSESSSMPQGMLSWQPGSLTNLLGPATPAIDMSDLDNPSKRLSVTEEDERGEEEEKGIDALVEQQQQLLRSTSALSMLSIPRCESGDLHDIVALGSMDRSERATNQVDWSNYLPLQRGGSIVGDPDDPLFQNLDVSQSGVDNPAFFTSPRSFTMPGAGAMRQDMYGIGEGMAGRAAWAGNGNLTNQSIAPLEEGLPAYLIPSNLPSEPLGIDRRVEDLLALLQPSPAAGLYRESVVRFIVKQVKKALGAQCFPVSGYALSCYLPDEDVRICAFFCLRQEQTWFLRVNEALCKMLGHKVPPEDEQGGLFEHCLNNVNFVKLGESRRVKCVVDNRVAVDLGANQLGELSMVAFLEEVDRALGKEHLLKKSLLLVKVWLLYESRGYTGSNLLSCISEDTLAVMVLTVINQHHRRLHTPLQVLTMFFHTYSRIDWDLHCVRVEGNCSLSEVNSDTHELPSCGGKLISAEMLSSHRLRHGERTSSRGESEPPPQRFAVRPMNVMHPLEPSTNLITDAVNKRRARRVAHVLQVGARSLQAVLLAVRSEAARADGGTPNQAGSMALLDSFFCLSWARFGKGWRPDVPNPGNPSMNASLAEETLDPLACSLFQVQENIKYCSFLLDAEVSDSALLMLSKEILAEKGPLPVGEIGKLLQEATANATLSQTLKDRYGGLKKFLENHPMEFLISKDHPFNPHVYLRSGMSEDEQEEVMYGRVGEMAGRKKKGARRKQKSGTGSLPGAMYPG